MDVPNGLLVPAMVIAGVAMAEWSRRRYQRRSGKRIGFLSYLWKTWEDPRSLMPPKPAFNGHNGFALVGMDWLFVFVAALLTANWVFTGETLAAILAFVGCAVVIGVAGWRIRTGRTGETMMHAGPKR